MNREQKITPSSNETNKKSTEAQECCILLKKGEEVELGACELSVKGRGNDE